MNRRDFLKAGTAATVMAKFGTLFVSAQATADASPLPAGAITGDVLVYGSTPSGIAAAVSAARQGCKVVLACPKKHPGGALASGLCTLDSRRSDVHSSFVFEFKKGMKDAYEAIKKSEPADQWSKGHGHEPSVAEAFFLNLIQTQNPSITYLPGHDLTGVTVVSGRIRDIQLEAPDGSTKTVATTTYIDATYEGDLAAEAKVPYRVGREAAAEFNEPLAGIRYVNYHTGEGVPTSDTGDASPYIQAYCARCVFTTDTAKLVPFTKPDTYEQHLPDLLTLIEDFNSNRIHNRNLGSALHRSKWELNGSIDQLTSLDCPGMNFDWPEADRKHRAELEKFHIDHAASYVWFLQNDPRIPDRVRAV